MADKPPAGQETAGVLTRKAGPFPVWVWAVGAVGIWYWYTHYGPGASSSSAAGAQAIDPNTGVPYAEELANAQSAPTIIDVPAGPAGPAGPPGPPGSPGNPGGPNIPPPIHDGGPRPRHRGHPNQRPPRPRRGPPPPPPGYRQPPPARRGGRPLPGSRGGGGGPPKADVPVGAPGSVVTPHGPVYDQWSADALSVPEPEPGYAPMTAGSIYG